MPLAPTQTERLGRARGDLRLGLPVVLAGEGRTMLAAAVETLGADRLAALRALGQPELALTARRAGAVEAPAYYGRLTRPTVPQGGRPGR